MLWLTTYCEGHTRPCAEFVKGATILSEKPEKRLAQVDTDWFECFVFRGEVGEGGEEKREDPPPPPVCPHYHSRRLCVLKAQITSLRLKPALWPLSGNLMFSDAKVPLLTWKLIFLKRLEKHEYLSFFLKLASNSLNFVSSYLCTIPQMYFF
jgi:hypothetical protein